MKLMNRLNEVTSSNISLSSFKVKKTLNSDFWKDNTLDSRIRLQLMDIADDFIHELSVDWVKPEDVILTGSIANYNWSRYSDVDIHILYDYTKIYPKNQDFVKDYFNAKKEGWLANHEELKIYGFPVEISVENAKEKNPSSGRYSLYKNSWLVEPDDFQDATINQDYVKRHAAKFMTQIDDLEKKLNKETDTHRSEVLGNKMCKVFDKLKDMRTEGLSSLKKEMSSGNIIYKILRRAGYIDKIWNAVNKSYDRVNSISENKHLNEWSEDNGFSAGIIPFRMNKQGKTEVFLGMPGKPKNPEFNPPMWMTRWNILKGHSNSNEKGIGCAIREFCEETGIPASFIDSTKLVNLDKELMGDGRLFYCWGLDLTGDEQFDTFNFHSNLIDSYRYIQLNGGKPYPEIEKYGWLEVGNTGPGTPYETSFYQKCDQICQARHKKQKSSKKTIVISNDQENLVRESLENETIAWHGSGAEFNSFDHSFMNTGEGAQAHGWGTYVAVDQKVGKQYAKDMKNGATLYVGGREVPEKQMDDGRDHPAYAAYYALCDYGTTRKALNYIERISSLAQDERMSVYWEQVISLLKSYNKKDFKIVNKHYLYEVEIPDNNGSNYIESQENVPAQLWDIFVRKFRGENRQWALEIRHKNENDPEYTCRDFVKFLGMVLGSPKKASQFLHKLGFVGIHYHGSLDGECYVIFDENNIKILNRTLL